MSGIKLNTQIPQKIDDTSETILVHEVFYTIQGEGPFAGIPAVFVRLAGCNVQCPFCDTQYTGGIRYSTRQDGAISPYLWDVIKAKSPLEDIGLVVFTGGEPLRQREALGSFLRNLSNTRPFDSSKLRFQIETNGTLAPLHFLGLNVDTVVSPKAPNVHDGFLMEPGYYFWKFVVRDGLPVDERGIQPSVLGTRLPPYAPPLKVMKEIKNRVYIQPLDEQDHDRNKANARLAAKICMEHGYRFGLQLHKFVDLP